MSRTIDSPSGYESFADDPTPAQQVQAQLRGKSICPFCGTLSESAEGPCSRCTMENTPLTRQATRARLGPWYVLQTRNPAAPGMKYSVLLSLVKKGQITPRSIVRGPTTNQFWRFAAKVRGISREFGICWGCGQDIAKNTETCPHCQRSQVPGPNADQLLDSRQPISQILPVRREIRPAFPGQPPVRGEAAMQEAMHSARHPVNQLPAPQHEPSLEELAQQELAQMQRLQGGGALMPARGGLPPALLGPQGQFPTRPVPPTLGEPRRPLAKALLMLVLMAAFTVAGWLYVDTPTREWVFAWATEQWERLSQPAAAPAPTTPSAPNDLMEGLTGKKVVANPVIPEPATPHSPQPPPVEDTVAQTPPPPPVATPQVEPEPAPVVPPVRAEVAPPPPPAGQADVRIAPPVQRPEPASPPAAAPATPAHNGVADVQVTADVTEALRTSRRLWREALDAEGRGEWATAVRLYEQILSLPPEAWPGGLQVNLKIARDRAGQ